MPKHYSYLRFSATLSQNVDHPCDKMMGNKQTSTSYGMTFLEYCRGLMGGTQPGTLPKAKEDCLPDLMQERVRLVWVYKSNGLSMNVLRVICEYLLSPRSLTHLVFNQIRCFDVSQKKWRPLCNLSMNLSKDYTLCYTLTMCMARTFVICGGIRKMNAAHVIESGKVTALPNLRVGRYSHGALYIAHCNKIYVFGGASSGSIEHCESLDLQSRSWQKVASMHKRRANINPVLCGHLVFIVGGGVESTIESYDWKKDCFTLLPSLNYSQATHFLSVITNDSMLCISESCSYRVNLQTWQVSERYEGERTQINNTVSMMKLDDIVLFADEHRCVSYSLEDGKTVEVIEDI